MTTYWIFGRTEYAKPLALLGKVQLDDDAALTEDVLAQYGDKDWVEVVALPETAILTVITPEKELEHVSS